MTKLFSLESSDSPNAELLIDKVIRQADKNKEGMQVTAELIKQRQVLKQEIDKELKKGDSEDSEEKEQAEEGDSEGAQGDETEEEGEGEGEEDNAPQDEDSEEEGGSEEGGGDEANDGEKEDKQDGEEGEEEDATDAAQDAGELEALVGSDHKKKAPAKDKEPEVAKESFRGESVVPVKLFGGIVDKHLRYVMALEEYNLTPQGRGAKDQNVAYVKEEVLESLKKMTSLATRYAAKNAQQCERSRGAVLALSERLTVHQSCHQAHKLHLTLKAVDDNDVLRALSVPGSSDLKETSSLLIRYLDQVSVLVTKTLQNDLSTLDSSFTACGYRENAGVYEYHKTLPGFVVPKASCAPYQDYLRTKYSDYQAYRHQAFKTEELYNLSAISLDKDTELLAVLERLSSIVVHIGLMVDNLKEISEQYNTLIEKVKATCFDIEQEKVKQLADLDIDARLKDFIRFKISSELYHNAIDMSLEYVTAALSAFSALVELDE